MMKDSPNSRYEEDPENSLTQVNPMVGENNIEDNEEASVEVKLRSNYTPSEENFPYFQLSILFFASFTSAIPLVGLFPYVAFMVVDLGAARNIDEAGYVSGYLASSFMAGRIVSSFYWGHVADKAGRLPVAYISCISIIVFSLTFGMSINFWMAAISRFALGMLNPFNTLTKTMISDLCCKKHQPMGMSLATGSWSVGLVIGPALGGLLARPCIQYPDTFGGIWLFENFPYLLPNLITVGMVLISIVLIWLYMPETAPIYEVKKARSGVDEISNNNSSGRAYETVPSLEIDGEIWIDRRPSLISVLCVSNESNNSQEKKPSLLSSAIELMKIPRVMRVCVAYFLISVTSIIFDEVFPLWAQASIQSGGLSMTGATVGKIGSVTGIPMIITTFFIFPKLSKTFGSVTCFRYGQLASTIFTASVVFAGYHGVFPKSWILPLLMILSSGSRCFATIAFASIFVLTNNSVSIDQRGAVNGLSMTIGGVAKAVGPAFGSIVFAWSINNGIRIPPFNFTLVFLLCLVIGICGCFLPLDSDIDASIPTIENKISATDTSLATSRHGLISDELDDGYSHGEVNELEGIELGDRKEKLPAS